MAYHGSMEDDSPGGEYDPCVVYRRGYVRWWWIALSLVAGFLAGAAGMYVAILGMIARGMH